MSAVQTEEARMQTGLSGATVRDRAAVAACRHWLRAALLLLVLGSAAGLQAQPAPLRVIIFPSTNSWPLYVGVEKGFFARHEAALVLTHTPGSTFQMQGLARGDFDIGFTLMDNVIAHVEGQGEPPIVPAPHFVAFMGSTARAIEVLVPPEVTAAGQLRGRTVVVDSLGSGLTWGIIEFLRRGGLPQGAYTLLSAGGVPQRVKAIEEGRAQAGSLGAPFDLALRARGFHPLALPPGAAPVRFEGLVGAARREWLDANGARVEGFIRGFGASMDWLYDRANQEEALRILRQWLPETSAADALKSYQDSYGSGREVFRRDLSIDAEAVRTTMSVRAGQASPRRELTDPHKYFDLRYQQRARGAK